MASLVRARNELVRVAIQLDPSTSRPTNHPANYEILVDRAQLIKLAPLAAPACHVAAEEPSSTPGNT